MTCIQELYASACLYTLRPGLFSRGGEHSGTCYHENTVKHNKVAGDWAVQGLTPALFSTFALPVSPTANPFSLFAVRANWWTRLCFNRGCTVTSWVCGHSPGRGFHRCTSACSAGASWGTDAWKRWAGTWYRRGVGCCYWSHCGSRCPCRPQRCPDPRLDSTKRGGKRWHVVLCNVYLYV